jgi:hypothetical protein
MQERRPPVPKFTNNTENMAEFFAPSWGGIFHINPGVSLDVRAEDASAFRAKFPGFPETPDPVAADSDDTQAGPAPEVYAATIKFPEDAPVWAPSPVVEVPELAEEPGTKAETYDPSVTWPLTNAETLG